MNYVKQIERLQLLCKLIKEERTGSPEELAKRLGVSKRQLFNQLETLKNMGASIDYSRDSQTYFYSYKSYIEIKFSISLLKDDESEKIFGGNQLISKCNFISFTSNIFTIK